VDTAGVYLASSVLGDARYYALFLGVVGVLNLALGLVGSPSSSAGRVASTQIDG
jgi:hypothetical protein